MKKTLLIIFLLLSVIILSACSGSNDPKEKFELPLKITAKLETSEAEFTAYIEEDRCDIIFSGRHALAGTELKFRPEGNSATIGDFTRDVPEGIFPAQETLIKAVRGIAKTEQRGTNSENAVKYTIDETEIMVYYDMNTGIITGIETKESGRRYKFTVVSLESYETQSNGAG